MNNGEVQGWMTTDALRERTGRKRARRRGDQDRRRPTTVIAEKGNMNGGNESIGEGGVAEGW